MPHPKIWFITGASKGFGRIWAEAALERGDKVAATARNVAALGDLADRYGDAVLPLTLDVNSKAVVDAAVKMAYVHFGRLDVVVNNAGFGLFGAIEEVTEQQVRDQFETNVFGALWVTKAAIPVMKAQGSGHIIQVSSSGGVGAVPTLGIYNGSKWALEGFSQALAGEVASFGIKVTLVEPTAYDTDWSGASVRAAQIADYNALRAGLYAAFSSMKPGVPAATAAAILAIVDADQPPLRVFLGKGLLDRMRAEYAQRLATWEAWNEVAELAMGH